MPSYFQDIEDRRIGTGTTVPFTQDEFPAIFPFARWSYQADRYLKYWWGFTGQWLNETMPEGVDDHGNPALRYPLQINYLKKVCMEHSYVLFGEVNDTPGPLAPIRITPRNKPGKDKVDDAARTRADELEDFINRVWTDNNGRSLQQEAGLLQSFLGGIVFRLGWNPEDLKLEYGIRLEHILPDFFLPVWDTGRPEYLLEAWVIYRMSGREAHLRFGYDLADGAADPLFIEHWTEKKVTIKLGDKPLKYKIGSTEFLFDDMDNPFGKVPFFYIPRERAGSFYGLSLLDDVVELAKEMNARQADISDVIEEVSHRDTYIRNVNTAPKTMDIGGTRPAINLGQTPPGGEEPDVFAIDPPPLNEAMVNHVETLRQQFGRDTFIPGVAEGEDEGSQRSALTLAFRMHPLTAKVRAVRTYWTTGLILIAKAIAQLAAQKGIAGITTKHLEEVDWAVDWSPMIPRDREADLNEVAIGIQSQMITPRDGNKLLNLTEDAQRTEEDVMKWLQFLQQLAGSSETKETTSAPSQGKVQVHTKTQAISTIMKEPGEQ